MNLPCGPPLYSSQDPRPRSENTRCRPPQKSNNLQLQDQTDSANTMSAASGLTRQTKEVADDIRELRRKWVSLLSTTMGVMLSSNRLGIVDSRMEASEKLYDEWRRRAVANLPGNEEECANLLRSKNAQDVTILSLLKLAVPLADSLAAESGCSDSAEVAYMRMVTAYRRLGILDVDAWYEGQSLLRKMADMCWKVGDGHRAEKFAWDALVSDSSREKRDLLS